MSGPLTSQAVHLARIVRCGGRTEASPDRLHLTSALLPAFARLGPRLLWIGVQRYTRSSYAVLERHGAECWTLDIDPHAAAWGRQMRRLMGDLLDENVVPPGAAYSGVLCNGVFGYGIDEAAQQEAAIRRMAALLEPGGRLLLGWNTHKPADPLSLLLRAPLVHEGFQGLKARTTVSGTTHVFDLFRREGA